MKCSNCGFESQEGANRCRRCGEPLVVMEDAQSSASGGDEEFTDFSQNDDFVDFSQEADSADATEEQSPPPSQPPPLQMPPDQLSMQSPPLQMPPDQFPMQPPSQMPPDFLSPPPVQEKKLKERDPDAEYIDEYVFPTTSLINELFLGKTGSTDPSIFSTSIVAILLTLFFYKVFPMPSSTGYFKELFTERGVWPYASVFLLWWAICLEINKIFRFVSQRKTLYMNLFPPEFKRITAKNVCKLQRHLLQLFPNPLAQIVTNRMWVALQQYRNLGHMEEVNDIVQYQAEIDLGSMESSYSFLNLLIWAHPIVGFLGTVVGIGGAIGGFTRVIESAVEIDAIKGALQVVTGGLSVAFDTTLIGLVFAMILMFTSTPLKKMEEDFLNDLENFIIRQLLNRMRKPSAGEEEEGEEVLDESARIRKMIEETFQRQVMSLQSAFQTWEGGFSTVIGQINQETQALGQQFSAVTPIVTDFRQVMTQFSGQVKETARQQEGMLQEMSTHVQKITPVISDFQRAMEGMDAQRQMISKQLADWAGDFNKLGVGVAEKFDKMGEHLGSSLDKMAEGNVSKMEKMGENISESMQKVGSGMVDKLGKVSSDFISNIGKHSKEQNTSLTKMNEAVTKEISKMSGDLIDKLEDHIFVFEKFQKDQAENMSSQSKNLDSLSSSLTGEFTKMSETILSKLEGQVATFQKFSDQYSKYMTDLMGGVSKEIGGLTEKIIQQFEKQISTWFADFTKEQTSNLARLSETIGKSVGDTGENVILKFDSQLSGWIQNINKELTGNIGQVSDSVARNIGGIGENIIKNYEQSSQKIIGEMDKMIQGQGSTMEKVIKGFEDVNRTASGASSEAAQKMNSLAELLNTLSNKQDKLIGAVVGTMKQMSSNEGLHRKSLDSQAEMLQAFNTGIDKVTSGTMFQDTLDGIRSGIETIKPELQQLATNISEVAKKSN